MADYDFGDLASPTKTDKKQNYDFGDLATAKITPQVTKPMRSSDLIPGQPGLKPPTAPAKTEEEPGILDTLKGAGETALSLGTGALAGPIGAARGLYEGVTGGKLGTQAGVEQAKKKGGELAEKLTYTPKTETGKKFTGALGDFFKDSGIEALVGLGGEASAIGEAAKAAKPALAARAGQAAQAARPALASLSGQALESAKSVKNIIPKKQTMSGVGAAESTESLLRSQRALDLPVPIELTKGQKERTFQQQKFERETAKLKEGEPLRERFAKQNEQVLQNFDAFVDKTGAEQPSLRQIGEVVNKALINKVKKAKQEINSAYEEAKSAGEMEQKVNLSSLGQYIEKNKGASKNANILKLVQSEIKDKSQPVVRKQSSLMGEPLIKPNPFERNITLNDLEEIRKTIGKNSTEGTPNAVYGQEMKKIIDQITEGKGGNKYKEARRLYENYSKEFKDKAAISKLLRNKPGTTDRAVAMEDVFDHSIMKGSLDDVRAVRRTLQTGGPDGKQAWKELQGQTLKNIKDVATSNSARDIKGNPIISPDKLNKLITELDKDGKLQFIFGKKGAEQLRDVNDLAKDIYTSPPGSVNYSNTASVLLGLLDTSISGLVGLPIPVASALGYGVRKLKSRALSNKVNQALGNDKPLIPPPPKP